MSNNKINYDTYTNINTNVNTNVNTENDVYNNTILKPRFNYYSSLLFNRKDIKTYMNNRDLLHKKDMYNKLDNLTFIKYQKELILHKNDYETHNFNSCIFNMDENNKLGCLKNTKQLYKQYFENNINKNEYVLKSINKDIEILNKKMF